jgi:hypothetical protein
MVQARDQIAATGGEVLFVAYHDLELVTTQMMRDVDVPYTLLVDSTREAYREWGLGKPGFRHLLSPGLYWEVLKMVLRREPSLGEAPPGEGQLLGDFVVGRRGTLALVHRLKSAHDRVKIPELLAALRSA